MLESTFVIVVFTTVFTWLWYSLYKILRVKYDLEGEFTTRIIAGSHGLVSIILAYACLKAGPDPLTEPGEPNTKMQIIAMEISLGYFMYDFVWCLKFQPEVKIILIHHFGSIFSLTFILACGCSGAEAIGGLGSMELTNPLLQARWFLRTYNKRDTILFQIIEYSFFALFLTVRLGYGSHLLYSVLRSEKTFYTVKGCTIAMFLISLAFIYSIVEFIMKKINSRNRTIDDDIKLS